MLAEKAVCQKFFRKEIWAESSYVLFVLVKETIDGISLFDKFNVSTVWFLTVPRTVFLEPNFIPMTSGISFGIGIGLELGKDIFEK